jgi:hypothetical protein
MVLAQVRALVGSEYRLYVSGNNANRDPRQVGRGAAVRRYE